MSKLFLCGILTLLLLSGLSGKAAIAQNILITQLGTVSDGHCRCKDQCDAGISIFTEGRTVAECKAKCVKAFSGCTKGEIRSTTRRDQ